MIIQNTPPINQATQPEIRASNTTPARIEPQVVAVANETGSKTSVQPSVEQLKSAIAVINKFMQASNHNLQFSVDTETNRTVVKMVDASTGELIRQYPSEATLAISRDIDRFQHGMLLTQKA